MIQARNLVIIPIWYTWFPSPSIGKYFIMCIFFYFYLCLKIFIDVVYIYVYAFMSCVCMYVHVHKYFQINLHLSLISRGKHIKSLFCYFHLIYFEDHSVVAYKDFLHCLQLNRLCNVNFPQFIFPATFGFLVSFFFLKQHLQILLK